MKKTKKVLLFGFAIAILGAFSLGVRANADGEVDCSVVSTDECHVVLLPGGNTMTFSGKAKIKQE